MVGRERVEEGKDGRENCDWEKMGKGRWGWNVQF